MSVLTPPARQIDPRGQRFGAGVSAIVLAIAFALDLPWLAVLVGLNLGVSAAFGTRLFLPGRLWPSIRTALRLGPPREPEHEYPPRFAQALGATFLGLAAIAFLLGADADRLAPRRGRRGAPDPARGDGDLRRLPALLPALVGPVDRCPAVRAGGPLGGSDRRADPVREALTAALPAAGRPGDARRPPLRHSPGDLRLPDAPMTRRGIVLFALMSVIWGIPYLFIRVAVAEITPAVLVLARTSVAAAILLPIALLRVDLRPILARWRWVAAFAADRDRDPVGHARVRGAAPVELADRAPDRRRAARRHRASRSLTGGADRLDRIGWLGLLIGLVGVVAIVGADFGGHRSRGRPPGRRRRRLLRRRAGDPRPAPERAARRSGSWPCP